MSDSNLLQRYTRQVRPEAIEPASPLADLGLDPDAADDFACFGYLRGNRERALMLELRKRTGDVLAVGYGWIEQITFNPSEGITLHLGSQSIRILGTRLNAEVRPNVRLFEGLTRHRVSWVSEGVGTSIALPAGQPQVQEIAW